MPSTGSVCEKFEAFKQAISAVKIFVFFSIRFLDEIGYRLFFMQATKALKIAKNQRF